MRVGSCKEERRCQGFRKQTYVDTLVIGAAKGPSHAVPAPNEFKSPGRYRETCRSKSDKMPDADRYEPFARDPSFFERRIPRSTSTPSSRIS
ncbi:hypothetical protein PUN28_001432 [Cardiocondyla obscurior]|uniref:Uncharacterized protein n=1 Tax=Cardiocondyla obscurior TaxID=286306 RepID=A0AAW2H5L5_9HYME